MIRNVFAPWRAVAVLVSTRVYSDPSHRTGVRWPRWATRSAA